jgi:hypothetical protein
MDLAKQALIQIQTGNSPLVERESIIFWIFYIQLRYNVIIHASRQVRCHATLSRLWDKTVAEPRVAEALRFTTAPETPDSAWTKSYFHRSTKKPTKSTRVLHLSRGARRRRGGSSTVQPLLSQYLPTDMVEYN